MSDYIAHNINIIRQNLPDNVQLVCVSKYYPVEAIRQAYDAGERNFGESRLQELKQKAAVLPPDIKWHFIGHLQRNKVRDVVGLAYLIHSVDSLRLIEAIERVAAEKNIVQKCLLEIHIAQEQTKSGFTPHEFAELIRTTDFSHFSHVEICGLMGMASNTDNQEQIRQDFSLLKSLATLSGLKTLSMGMSDDYRIAIEQGSTMVRIGSAIFED
ncbi:MAG: YggS family pyridoxal phosphate-dependent enzyme [Paludibacteraceae bacterium]|nr:YggS family pyridoxal phosphate-dependent enzyme [Paludibacteraceae bacterium]